MLHKRCNLLVLLVLLLFIACKEQNGQQAKLEKDEKIAASALAKNAVPGASIDAPPEAIVKNGYPTCEALVIDLVKSSNAQALKNFKAVQVRMVDINAEQISLALYAINNISDDPSSEKMTAHAVGWLEFFPATGILQDITNDPENPEKLQYDTTILQKAGLDKLCDTKGRQ